MSKRITFMIDEDVYKKLRAIQGKQIKESEKSVSFSRVVNEILQKSLKG